MEYTAQYAGFEHTTFVAIGPDCTGNCKANHLTITTTTFPSTIVYYYSPQ